jgi:hypothetical protein
MSKNFLNIAAQGDFVIIRINELPEGIIPCKKKDGKWIVAHSETGHNHVMEADCVEMFKVELKDDDAVFELYLSVSEDTQVQHHRSYDTHEALNVTPGNYKIRRQREYTSEGWRRAAD